MKKKRLIILLSVLAVVLVIGCFAYLYRAAAAEKAFFYEYCVDNEEADTVNERLNTFPEQIELGCNMEPGYIVHFQNYSLTLSGYNDVAADERSQADSLFVYNIDKGKHVILNNLVDDNIGGSILNNPAILSQVEKAAGRKINNRYDLWEALYYCTPEDYTLLDADKNIGVSRLLELKNLEMRSSCCYQYNNGVIKGFIRMISDVSFIYFSNCEVPDSFYQISFFNFSIEEVKGILSTIKFDGSEDS